MGELYIFTRFAAVVGSPIDILLVDDAADDVALFGRAVAKSGLNIRLQTVTTGQQAIDYLQAKGEYHDRSLYPLPDVIVLDLRMPGVSGFDFLAWRNASVFAAAIRVVVFSGSRDEDEVKRVRKLGADQHFFKPQDGDWSKVVADICGSAGCRPGVGSARAAGQ